METFGPLFWSHVDSFLHNFRDNKHVLFRPPTDRLMARGRSQPPSDPGEGPVPPQEQEDLGEGGRVLQGEYPLEGDTPWELWDPAEGVAS